MTTILDSDAGSSSKPVRVVHVITGLQRAGAETMLYKLLKGFSDEATSHAVISFSGLQALGERIQALGVPVYTLETHPLNPLYTLHLARLLNTLQPEIIHSWMYRANLLALLGRSLSRQHVPLIWGVRAALDATHPHPSKTMALIRVGAFLSSRPQYILYNSGTSAIQHGKIGYDKSRAVVIPNGFDCDVFRPSMAARKTVRVELDLPQDALLIGFVARYDATKDFETFFAAIARVFHTRPNVYAVMAGRKVTQDNAALFQRLNAHGIDQNRVRLLGERRDVARLDAAMDVNCSSSLTEAFSNSIGEAMACGVPNVVTDVGDSAYLVEDTGRVVQPSDSEAMATALLDILSMSPDERATLGLMARRRIERHFSLKSVTQRFNLIYQELAGGVVARGDVVEPVHAITS